MRLLLGLLATIAFAASASAQEVAGRVLVSHGEVVLSRGASTLTPNIGSEVRTGDRFRLGNDSYLQLRLTDESLISLQPGSTFELTEYAFASGPESQRAVFRLVAGALRTVTGLVGRVRKQDYVVRTPTSTIGIRGTHYQVAHFEQAVGQLKPGTYGVVTDGGITVNTGAGEQSFGADRSFHVPGPNQPAVALPGPPPNFGPAVPPPSRPSPAQEQQQRAQGQVVAAAASTGDARTSNAASGITVQAAPKQDAVTSTSAATGGSSSGTTEPAAVSATSQVVAIASPVSLISVSGPATVIGSTPIVQASATGTVLYRLEGPFNIVPTACGNPPCNAIVNGNIFFGVNLSLQRAVFSVNLQLSNGEFINASSPSPLGGIPVTVSNGVISFNQTLNRTDFPQNTGSFRCSQCGTGNTPGFMNSITASGTISGGTANITFSGTDAGGGGSFSVSLPQVTAPNNLSAAAITPVAGGGANNAGGSYWSVDIDSSGKLLAIGPGSTTSTGVGMIIAKVGSATNTIAGSAPSAGNLVWGSWTGAGSTITDFNYVTSTTTSGSFIPWITGTAPNTLPASLGSFTYTPVGSLINAGTGILNSASLTANFVNRSLSLSINARNLSSNNTFQMNGTNSFSPITGRFGGGFNSVTCSGTCQTPNTPGGSYNGFFAGANAEGAGVAFTAGFGVGTGVSGVVAFKR